MSRPKSIITLNDPDAADVSLHTINAAFYGPPGIGKTVLSGTAPKGIILDSDLGTESAAALGSKCDVMPVTDYQELSEAYEYLAHDKHDYRWIGWDSLTLFQDRTLIDDILVDAHAENPRQSEDVASQREYLISQNRISKYIRLFAGLPYNFFFTAHVMTAEDNDGNNIYMPFIAGKKGEFASKIAGYMNVVGYLGFATVDGANGKKQVQRMQFRQTGEIMAKDRFNALGAYMDRPTIPKIEAAIQASRKRKG